MSFIHKMILFLAYIQKPEWMLESFNLKTKVKGMIFQFLFFFISYKGMTFV